jgi:hypothetical protein
MHRNMFDVSTGALLLTTFMIVGFCVTLVGFVSLILD